MLKRDIYVLSGVGLLTVVLALGVWLGSVLPTGSWGLSFRQEGAPPIGTAGADQLGRYDAAYLGDTSEKVLYLTFDAGYENGCTEQILDTLKKHNVKAAFFLVGNYIQRNAFSRELSDLAELYEQTVGQPMPRYYRPPQGIYSEENLKMAQQLGYRTVFWSLAYVDWNNDAQPSREQALSKLLPRTHPGAVVLLHSTSKTNAEILDELLTKWEEAGYRFGTVEELFPKREDCL